MPKSMPLRLTDEQAAALEPIARVENVPIAEEVRVALAEHIEKRRRDSGFQARLKASIKRNQEILDRLAEMPRVVSLATSALSVPAAGWQGHEAYPELAQKAGLLAARLAKNHPLPDGNKRAAWLAMIEFIERNGYQFEQPEPHEAVEAMLGLASSEIAEADF